MNLTPNQGQMKGKTLVVVDMQEYFLSEMNFVYSPNHIRKAYRPFIKRVASLVGRAANHGVPTIFLEYGGLEYEFDNDKEAKEFIETHPLIKRANPKAFRVKKYKDGGGRIVRKFCKEHGLPLDFIVCGINADACVYATVEELAPLPVHIVNECTRNVYDTRSYFGYGNIASLRKINYVLKKSA